MTEKDIETLRIGLYVLLGPVGLGLLYTLLKFTVGSAMKKLDHVDTMAAQFTTLAAQFTNVANDLKDMKVSLAIVSKHVTEIEVLKERVTHLTQMYDDVCDRLRALEEKE